MTKCQERLGAVIDILIRDHRTARFYSHDWSNDYPLVDFWYYTCSQDWREIQRARSFEVTVARQGSNGVRVTITGPKLTPDERTTYEVFWV